MSDVKWIKLKVGMFDGKSFKKIKRAKIGGESYRDKLTAVWFELMDFAGKCNHSGAFIDSHEIPFTDLEDIAIMIDRELEELQLCMSFFVNEGMVAIVDDIYMLSNWTEYQNETGLEEIREKNRQRQAKFREKKRLMLESATTENKQSNVTHNVTVTSSNALDIDIEEELELDIEKREKKDCKAIVSLFNEICVSYPSVRSLSDSRKKAIKARLTTYTQDDFKTLFEKAESSEFLKGKNSRNWSANFDWLIKDANMAKVLDGNYDNKKNQPVRSEMVPDWMDESKRINQARKFRDSLLDNPNLSDRVEKLKAELGGD